MKAAKPRLLAQLFTFVSVGGAATLTHASIAQLALLAGASAFLATLIGFLVAFSVSYLGHFHLTFKDQATHRHAFWRFFAVAVTGFTLSLGGLWVFTEVMALPKEAAVLCSVLLIPAVTWTLSRFWAFRPRT